MVTLRQVFSSLITLVVLVLALAVTSTPAQQAPAPLKTATKEGLGTFLVDAKGMTLYLFDNDKEPGKSTCAGGCVRAWPPYGPQAGDPAPVAPLGVMKRDDGSEQYTYDGKPLYYFNKDKKPGDATGQGAGERWWVVKP
jgi:predicted lipoprotein with Yx(FWY)xxD motif